MSAAKKETKKITTHVLQEMKARGEKISMLTAYDYSMARILDGAGIDVILVGDSASNVMAGNETTLPITLDQIIYHATSVVRGVRRSLVVVDIPFGYYQGSSGEGLRAEVKDSVLRILSAGVPVMGHLGLTPQSIYKFGTYSVRAKEDAEATKLMDDALLLQECGCFGIVLEKIPAALAAKVSKALTIPTIGIGAGSDADGQVLVMQDMLGITKEFQPRFLRRYADLDTVVTDAVKRYIKDVKAKDFPNKDEMY